MFLFKKSYCLIYGICSLLSLQVVGQDMNSPYSAYGIGDLDMQQYNMNAGMGYTGIGLKSSYFSSGNNPASATGLPRSFLIFQVSGNAKISTYKGTPINADNSINRDFTIKNISLAEKMNSFWATGIGFRQFSSVNYRFNAKNAIEGSDNTYISNFTGNGGLNEYFWNNAFNIGKRLSAGITTSFISGPIFQGESITLNDLDIESQKRDYYGNFRLEYGAIYNTDASKRWVASIGLKYAPKSKLNFDRSLSVTNNSVAVVSDRFLKYSSFELPASYGAGLALTNNSGTTFAFDYSFQDWSRLNNKGNGWQLVDANRISAGLEFAKLSQAGGSVHPQSFQIGAYATNSYLQINGQQINEFGVTAGIKRAIKNSLLMNAAVEAGTRGTTRANLIKENFVKLTFTFSLKEFIYSKGHKYN